MCNWRTGARSSYQKPSSRTKASCMSSCFSIFHCWCQDAMVEVLAGRIINGCCPGRAKSVSTGSTADTFPMDMGHGSQPPRPIEGNRTVLARHADGGSPVHKQLRLSRCMDLKRLSWTWWYGEFRGVNFQLEAPSDRDRYIT